MASLLMLLLLLWLVMDGLGLRPSSPEPKPYVGPAQPGPIQGFGGLRARLQFGGGPSLGPKPGLSLYNSVYLMDTNNDVTPELSSHHTTTTGPKLMPVPASTTALKRDAQQAALESSPESDHADHEGVTQTMRRKQVAETDDDEYNSPANGRTGHNTTMRTRVDDNTFPTNSHTSLQCQPGPRPKPGPGQAQAHHPGWAWDLIRPEPSEARPKPGLSGQARPVHH
ncbi:hypothetical protein BU15DRAFT_61388 [Melanogaster broomeanus]|nr:hypothetical protein BU15DRAFT_61388 [Melanogaster broomeanus]